MHEETMVLFVLKIIMQTTAYSIDIQAPNEYVNDGNFFT